MEVLSIIDCKWLRSLPKQLHILLPSLQFITIKDCQVLDSFVGGDEKGGVFLLLKEFYCYGCPKLNVRLPDYLPSLTKLEVWGCNQVVGLHQNAQQMDAEAPSPRTMKVENLSELETFPGLPNTIETVEIKGCKKLQFPWNHCYASLKHLEIDHSCNAMKSMALDYFPKLIALGLRNCLNLESFTISEISSPVLPSLITFELRDCPKFISFPRGGFPANKITSFEIVGCKNLRSFPEQMHTLLPSLESILKENCPEMESFPEGGLPSNITALQIVNCKKLFKHHRHWNLHTLTSLVASVRKCEDAFGSFPEEGMLPTTLTYLYISNFPNLEALNGRGLKTTHLSYRFSNREMQCTAFFACRRAASFPIHIENHRMLFAEGTVSKRETVRLAQDFSHP